MIYYKVVFQIREKFHLGRFSSNHHAKYVHRHLFACQTPTFHVYYIIGLVKDCTNSSALAMELLQSCINPSTECYHHTKYSRVYCLFAPVSWQRIYHINQFTDISIMFKIFLYFQNICHADTVAKPRTNNCAMNKAEVTDSKWQAVPKVAAGVSRTNILLQYITTHSLWSIATLINIVFVIKGTRAHA